MKPPQSSDARSLSRQVGGAFLGLGGFCLLQSVIWFVLRSQGVVEGASLVGAEGLLVMSALFLTLGWTQRRAREG